MRRLILVAVALVLLAAPTLASAQAPLAATPIVLGWSMGGNIAEVLVQRHPDKVNRLILAATDPGGPQAVQPTDPLAVKLLADTNPPISLLLKAIFPPTPAGRAASKAYVGRLGLWPDTGPDAFTTPSATASAQVRAEGPLWFCKGCGA